MKSGSWVINRSGWLLELLTELTNTPLTSKYFEIFVVPGPPQIFWSSLLLADTVVLQPEDAQLPENKEI